MRPSICGSSSTGSYGASFDWGVRMGNSIFDSMFANITHATSTAVTDLVLLLFTGHDACTSSLDLLLFLCGTRVSNSVADVEGTFPSSMTSLIFAILVSSSIKVPPHS